MLLLHTPNWRQINEIKNDNITWVDKMKLFLDSDQCPNFVKADVEKSKRHMSDDIQDQDDDSYVSPEFGEGPEWMDLLQPNPN